MQAINFSELSIAQLKDLAIELNAKVEGDKRLKATWVKACELAQAAMVKVGPAIDEFTGYEISGSVASTAQAMGEAYSIAHTQFVVPTEQAICVAWNFATSEQAIRLYLDCAIGVMKFCFAVYRSFLTAREWVDSVREESEAGEVTVYEVVANHAEFGIRWCASEAEYWIWYWDGEYQELVERVKQEARSIFSLPEWIAFLILR